MEFASDNTAGVCPEVLDAVAEEAVRNGAAYGDDRSSARLTAVLADVFEHDVAVYPVATGTAANSLALAATCPPWGGVLCHERAHVAVDELAAPTAIGNGLTLVRLPGDHGRIDPGAIEAASTRVDHGVHTVPFTALTLTQSTEAGTRYHVDDIVALGAEAAAHGLVVHMDGARFANAVAATGASPADLTWRAGVDILSLGATKGGAMAAEAVVVFTPGLAPDLDRHRKRNGHLVSKQRFVAAQFLGWLDDGAWLRHADHANALAARLGEGLADAGLPPVHPVETNMVFLALDAEADATLTAAGAHYYSQPLARGLVEGRFVTSWATRADEVERLITAALTLGRRGRSAPTLR